jgi:hypothetical protein
MCNVDFNAIGDDLRVISSSLQEVGRYNIPLFLSNLKPDGFQLLVEVIDQVESLQG